MTATDYMWPKDQHFYLMGPKDQHGAKGPAHGAKGPNHGAQRTKVCQHGPLAPYMGPKDPMR